MSNAFNIAASGLKTEEYYIDKLASDIANLNTNNYKSTQMVFSDAVYQTINTNEKTNSPISIGLGSIISQTNKNFSPGPLKPSSNWNDVAIDGQGFFQVILVDGTTAYSRSSSLVVDEDHYLAIQDGNRLADNIRIPEDAVTIKIHKNGEVEALLPNDSEPQLLGSIKLARFINNESLQTIGSSLYKNSSTTSDPIIDTPGNSGIGEILQNQIENSNVDMVASLMQLTMTQRIYQLNAKAIQVVDDMTKMINELRD